ncbi:MAG: shikimate dehydrogenase [Spirochaetota bacterium]
MIVLTTTEHSVDGVLAQVESQRPWIDGVELRVDRLDEAEWGRVSELPPLLREAGGEGVLICTVRRPQDGGRAACDEARRLGVLADAVAGGFDYIDLESDLPDDELHGSLVAQVHEAGVTIIRSYHDFDGIPANLTVLMTSLPRSSGEIPKCAVTPRSTADLGRLVETAQELGSATRILIGMGEYGLPTRVLAHRLGNLLTFASAPGETAAPGQLTPQVLAESYRVADHTDTTRVFAVVGNPIGHSKSPAYHNARFAEESIDACYVPVLVDDMEPFVRLAERLPILGFSVTIPHKRAVMAYLSDAGDDVRAANACNTVVRIPGGWRGVNTDVIGFLAPLDEVLAVPLAGVRVLVLGAGGAARGVVYALASRAADVVVWNRTASRARVLVEELAEITRRGSLSVLQPGADAAPAEPPSVDIVVNTTSLGMHGEGDPAPWYRFAGHEIVYDIVYTPPETPLVQRAATAGCRVITGDRMFAAQAAAQYELYRVLATADSADA